MPLHKDNNNNLFLLLCQKQKKNGKRLRKEAERGGFNPTQRY
jgi:hypothetical protein